MKIVLLGAGRVAEHLSQALQKGGHSIVQVYSRTAVHAQRLAERLQCQAVNRVETIDKTADLYLFAVKDDAIRPLAEALSAADVPGVFVHTAGSVSVDVFEGLATAFGVLYPLQTFTQGRVLDMRQIPMFVEADSDQTQALLESVATSVADKVCVMPSEKRRKLHLAAVFACNFVNHCYTMAADVLAEGGIPFEVLLPLIEETANKVREFAPHEAQTGPALRHDAAVMAQHVAMMTADPQAQQVYEVMSKAIYQRHNKSV